MRRPIPIVSAAIVLTLLAGCTAASTAQSPTATVVTSGTDLYDSSILHTISVDFDDADFTAMLDAYESTGDKNWISATVTIDGTEFENVGLRLKGNSTLRKVTNDESGDGASSEDNPGTIPWLIRLDKYVDGQSYQGHTDLVVRGNNSESSLNEAVALELVGLAGLATEQAIATRFSVNGGDAALRLVVEIADEETWTTENFDTAGVTYKAEAGGDYSYRGTDAAAYTEIFDQVTDDDAANLTPLTDFLKFINDADDATFASELGEHLDVEAFATYLAIQQITDNYDDIDGPGNNSYLRYDETTGLMTVVTWDENLTFGVSNRPGGTTAGGGNQGGGRPAGGGNGAGAGGSRGGNILAERFMATPAFAALYDAAVTDLTAKLFSSGQAQSILDSWTTLLTEQASDLVDPATVATESASISAYFSK